MKYFSAIGTQPSATNRLSAKKNYFLPLIGCCLLAVSQPISAQGTFDTRLSLKSVDCQNGKAFVQVEVKAHDALSEFNMGDANYRFTYNPNAAHNPRIVSQDNFSNQGASADRNYAAHNLQGSREIADNGIVSLNTFYTASNSGAKKVTAAWTPVSTIGFDIVDYKHPFELKWNDHQTFPITGMNQPKSTETDPGAYDYNLENVKGGQFIALAINTAAACPTKAPTIESNTIKTRINTPVEVQFPIYYSKNDPSSTNNFQSKVISVGHGTIQSSVLAQQNAKIGAPLLVVSYKPVQDFVGKDVATLEVTDKFGNTTVVNLDIVVNSDKLIVYNAVSPNDDGVNDFFVINGLEKYPNNELYIFGANGREIYHTKNYKNDWDGKYQGKKLVAGTYFYVLETGLDNETYKGYVQIEY